MRGPKEGTSPDQRDVPREMTRIPSMQQKYKLKMAATLRIVCYKKGAESKRVCGLMNVIDIVQGPRRLVHELRC